MRGAKSLKIHFDPAVGRHGRATREIKTGDVVLVDMPIANVPIFPSNQSVCFHCFNELALIRPVLSPFDADAVFCSQLCLSMAFRSYHCVESRDNGIHKV